MSAKHKDQLAANDVKWSHGDFSTTIATAVPNGQIVVHDINRPGVELARLHEHSRQVHKLGFSPYQGSRLLSGSQDGTVRMWDLRSIAKNGNVMSCQSLEKYQCNRDGIRDLKWSPTNGVEFAVGTDDGSIQRWDFRYSKAPLLQVRAHEKSCYTIDWHPDGKHLATGGGDKNILIWDFSSTNRKMKPLWNIRAPQAVVNICWRPACWVSDEQGPPSWQCMQIAASYDQQDPRIHIWDLRRPYVPLRVLDRYSTPASGLLWRSESLLWSVGSAGMFTQTDTNSASKTMDQRSPNVLAVAPNGRILFFSQKREPRRPSIEDALEDLNKQDQRRASASEKPGVQGTTHDSPEELRSQSSSFKKGPPRYATSAKSSKSLGGTPPPAGSGGPVLGLEKSLEKRLVHHLSQLSGMGYVEGLFDAAAFKFLAQRYRAPAYTVALDLPCDIHVQFSESFRANALLVEQTSQYRLSQSWNVLAMAVEKELYTRAVRNRERRTKASITSQIGSIKHVTIQSTEESVSKVAQNTLSLSERDGSQSKSLPISALDNASNMTTPLARPVRISTGEHDQERGIENFQLPDSVWSKQPVKPVSGVSVLAEMATPKLSTSDRNLSKDKGQHPSSQGAETQQSTNSNRISTEVGLVDIDRQMTERRAAMGNYRAMPRPLLRLDDPPNMASSGLNVPRIGRQDSDESFHMFSASTDSSHRLNSMNGSFESSRSSDNTTSTPERASSLPYIDDNEGIGHEEELLVFDDDVQLSQASEPLPLMITNAVKTEQERVDAIRPSERRQQNKLLSPIVHQEDMEELGAPAEAEIHEMPSAKLHEYVLSDFLPPEQDPEYTPPWTATAMFEPLIDFHQYKLKDVQVPSYLLLHLALYINHSIPSVRATRILLTYHDQLVSLQLYPQAAELRKLCLKRYPKVAEHGLYDVIAGGPWCTVCRRTNKGDKQRCCERCKQYWADCPVCRGEGPLELRLASAATSKNCSAGDKLWGWCQECGHGGHRGCLRTWWEFEESEGACPTVGCLCDCMPGARRDEVIRAKRVEDERKRKVVSKDEWTVGPSPAAQKARTMMGGQTFRGGRGATSLANAGRSASGGKKVRIVVPDEEGVASASGKQSASVS